MSKKADQYDDPQHNYQQYWTNRQYENDAEVIAIRQLLKGRHFHKAVDIGGGYGRLSPLLYRFADEVTLAEPSSQQLDLAEEYLKVTPGIQRLQVAADKLPFKDGAVDLALMVRVLHHLPEPMAELKELARILAPNGYAVIEFANYTHFVNRVKHLARGRRLPSEPVDIRSPQNRRSDVIPFVNHNPATLINQLQLVGLQVEKTLSVSNLRSPVLKKVIPRPVMLTAERLTQKSLARLYFGPSIFLLVKKAA